MDRSNDELRAQIERMEHVVYLARLISGQATMGPYFTGGMWTVTQSTMTSLRAALAALDAVDQDVR
jgi:hypothetical protein